MTENRKFRTRNSVCAVALLVLAACSPTGDVDREVASAPEAATLNTGDAPADTAPAADGSMLPAGVYRLDPSHASVTFEVSHLGFSNYIGQFETLDATLEIDPASPAGGMLIATIDPTSLDIPSPPAGFLEELLGPDWLAAGQFPEITYESTSIDVTGQDTATVNGMLTLHGQSAPVKLNVKFNGGWEGIPPDPFARAGFSAVGSLKRSDFGVTIGIPEPGTTMGVGDEVKFRIETEFSGPDWVAPSADETPQ